MDQPTVSSSGDDDAKITLLSYLDAPQFVQASSNATRLVAKLKIAVQNNELYETQQIIRTLYFRLKDKPEPLIDLLYYGALHLIRNGESISGQDLATLLLETACRRGNKTSDLDTCRKISQLLVNLPDTEAGQAKFIAEALKLLTPKILNRDLLHNVIATKYWQLKQYVNARYHFLHCANTDNALDVAHLLIEFHLQGGLKSEVDLFITQFILQFLCLQSPLDPPITEQSRPCSHQHNSSNPSNITVSRKSRSTIKLIAERIFSEYALKHPSLGKIEIPFNSLPLLNLTHFIISTLDSRKSEAGAFKLLTDIYKVPCGRDPNYPSYLNRIGIIYYGLIDQTKQQQQATGGGGNFFNNILMTLLDGTDEDEDDEMSSGRQAISSCDELD